MHRSARSRSRVRSTSTRRAPALASTLVAAAIAGELVAGTLAPVAAAAQADEPTHTEDAPAGAPAAAEPGPDDEPTPPVETPAPPPASPLPAAPAVPPESAAPVRTGYAEAVEATPPAMAEAAPSAVPRDGRETQRAPATRTGHDASEPSRSAGSGGKRDAPVADRTRPRAVAEHRGTTRGAGGAGVAAAAGGPVPTEHTVVAGEHLWGIAAAHLAALSGRAVATLRAEEIAPYWTRLCMLNVEHLRSGNPNLVHPGEVVRLPAV